jgi:hypothetical protein
VQTLPESGQGMLQAVPRLLIATVTPQQARQLVARVRCAGR